MSHYSFELVLAYMFPIQNEILFDEGNHQMIVVILDGSYVDQTLFQNFDSKPLDLQVVVINGLNCAVQLATRRDSSCEFYFILIFGLIHQILPLGLF